MVPRTTATAASSTIEVTTRHQYCCVGCTDFVVSSKTEPQEFLTLSVRDGCKDLNNQVHLTLDVSGIVTDEAYEIVKCRCLPDGESHPIVQGREYHTCGSSMLLFELSRSGLANAKGDSSTITKTIHLRWDLFQQDVSWHELRAFGSVLDQSHVVVGGEVSTHVVLAFEPRNCCELVTIV